MGSKNSKQNGTTTIADNTNRETKLDLENGTSTVADRTELQAQVVLDHGTLKSDRTVRQAQVVVDQGTSTSSGRIKARLIKDYSTSTIPDPTEPQVQHGTTKIADSRKYQAQEVMDHHQAVKLSQIFDTAAEWICGCDITSDGKILLTDFSHKKCLIGIDLMGNHAFYISTAPYDAFDVTCIDAKTVAVTSGVDRAISIVNISSRTVKKHIDVGYNCWGITHRDGTLLVCASDHGVLSIDMNNEEITTVVHCDLPIFSYITTYKDKLYYTYDESQSVTCCDIDGNTVWSFKDINVLRSLCGITTNSKGQVFVCDNFRDEIFFLSADGKQIKTIISTREGLNMSNAIHFDKSRNKLIITNKEKTVFLFNV